MDTDNLTPDNSYKASLFAELYDLILESLGRKDVDIGLLKSIAKLFNEPILEMGCGTGLRLLPLAETGYSVTGLDNSPQMLDILKKKLISGESEVKEKVQVVLADMVDPPVFRSNFGLIIFSVSQFLHLKTDLERLTCLKSCYNLLTDDGAIFISNSKLEGIQNNEWTDCPIINNKNDEWEMQIRGVRKIDFCQEHVKLISKLKGHKEHLFWWSLYPINDNHMKYLIGLAGLRCIPIPDHLPTRSTTNFYICVK